MEKLPRAARWQLARGKSKLGKLRLSHRHLSQKALRNTTSGIGSTLEGESGPIKLNGAETERAAFQHLPHSSVQRTAVYRADCTRRN
ncbi:hypothetical protein J6590_070987 [Homalodisca vitripennis]|nr:hypothetical protein J6590_070987 [Homalodisca vitripennis]